MVLKTQHRKPIFKIEYVAIQRFGGFVEYHRHKIIGAMLPVRAEIARLINEYLNARHGRTNKYGGDFPAVRWTFTPAR